VSEHRLRHQVQKKKCQMFAAITVFDSAGLMQPGSPKNIGAQNFHFSQVLPDFSIGIFVAFEP